MKKNDNLEETFPTEEMLCPIRYLMDMLGGKWKLPIICILSGEMPLRYNRIKRRLGDITNVMLSQSLKELEADGLVHRRQYNEIPPRVEYSLTSKGESILPLLAPLTGWAAENMKREKKCDAYCAKCITIN